VRETSGRRRGHGCAKPAVGGEGTGARNQLLTTGARVRENREGGKRRETAGKRRDTGGKRRDTGGKLREQERTPQNKA
jgi:hypothetical protein